MVIYVHMGGGGRVFIRRLLDRIRNLKHPHHRVRLTRDMRADMLWWLSFVDVFNRKITMVVFGQATAVSKKCTTIKQYMNIIRLLHLEWGLNNPLQDHFKLNGVLKGIKRQRGTPPPPARKLPITPGLLISILNNLNLLSPSECAVWAAGLIMFLGLLRRSNVLFSACNKGATLSRNQICFHSSITSPFTAHTRASIVPGSSHLRMLLTLV